MFIAPGNEENQADAGADGGVGNIEGGKTDFAAAALLHVKINEINDFVAAGQQAVGEVARDAAEDEAEGDLAGQRVGIEMMPRKEQRDKCQQCDKGERAVVAAKHAPRRAGVAPVDELEEAGDEDFFVAFFEQVQNEPFGELVKDEHTRCDDGNGAVGMAGFFDHTDMADIKPHQAQGFQS